MTRKTAYLTCSALLLALPQAALADTLQEALEAAYSNNPTLTAQRAGVRATDEEVPLARAAGLPTLDGTATYQENVLKGEPSFSGFFSDPDRQVVAQLNATVPIITFGAVTQSVNAAKERVAASRLGLRGSESELFTAVVGAYMDVLRDEAVVRLNERNTDVMRFTLGETQDRLRAGNRGPTDVAQAEARLALAESQLENSRAQLIGSRENYLRLVGRPPGELAPPPPLPNLPDAVVEAVDIALDNNPVLLAAMSERMASNHDVEVADAQRYPRLSAIGGVNQYDYLGSLSANTGPRNGDQGTTGFVGVRLDLPLFQGGRLTAQMRQAEARREQAVERVVAAERDVVADTRAAYATWRSAERVIGTSERGVLANSKALAGLRAEVGAGLRPLLDRLNAEQELLNAEVTLVTARRDAYVAGFALLAAMGRAEARDLNFTNVVLYDPIVHYDRSMEELVNWRDGAREAEPVSKGTVDVPAQDAVVSASGQPPVPSVPAAR